MGWGHAHLPLRRARGSVDAWAPAVLRAGTYFQGQFCSDFMQQHKCSWVLTFENLVGVLVFTCCRGVCLARARLVVAAWRVKRGAGAGAEEEGVFFKGKIV